MTSTSSSQGQSRPQSASFTVFDAYINSASTSASLSVSALTDDSHNDILGFYDQLALQVVVTDTSVGTAPAALTVQIAHSADEHNFVFKNAAPEVSTPTQLNIGTATYMSYGYDGGEAPSLAYVRLVIELTGAVGPVRAHVRITATGNNMNEQAFTKLVKKGMSEQTAASRQYVLEYGPGQKISTAAISELVRFVNDLPTISAAQINLQHGSNIAEAQVFLLWQPIIVMKNAGGFSGSSVTVPSGFSIAFLGNGHYALVLGNVALWESRQPSTELFPQRKYQQAHPTASSNSAWVPPQAHPTASSNSAWVPPAGGHFPGEPGLNSGGNPGQDAKFDEKGK
jgi:hypothetical protein